MTTSKKISIGAGLLVLLVGMAVLFVSWMTPMVSRIAVPGSSLTVIITADLAGCYDVELFDHGQMVRGSRQCLGPYALRHVSSQISTVSNIVAIALADGGYHYAIAVDITARQFVTESVSKR